MAEDGIRKSGLIFDELNKILNVFLNDVVRDTISHLVKDRRNTVFVRDVLCSLSTSSYFNGKRKQYIILLLHNLSGLELYPSSDTRCSRGCLSAGKRRRLVKFSSAAKKSDPKNPTHDDKMHGKLGNNLSSLCFPII